MKGTLICNYAHGPFNSGRWQYSLQEGADHLMSKVSAEWMIDQGDRIAFDRGTDQHEATKEDWTEAKCIKGRTKFARDSVLRTMQPSMRVCKLCKYTIANANAAKCFLIKTTGRKSVHFTRQLHMSNNPAMARDLSPESVKQQVCHCFHIKLTATPADHHRNYNHHCNATETAAYSAAAWPLHLCQAVAVVFLFL
jgi:hypothetical protein